VASRSSFRRTAAKIDPVCQSTPVRKVRANTRFSSTTALSRPLAVTTRPKIGRTSGKSLSASVTETEFRQSKSKMRSGVPNCSDELRVLRNTDVLSSRPLASVR
jgi:hypothetical protein